jgi:hypothetical protein
MDADYLKFLGYTSKYRTSFVSEPNGAAPIELLSGIQTLACLNFHFQVIRAHSEYMVSRRRRYLDWTSADPWSAISSREDKAIDHVSCQKVVVDWFFTMALTYLKSVPRITLSGDVKQSTRLKWEHILTDEHRGKHRDISREIQ